MKGRIKMSERLKDILRSTRKTEIFALVVLVALAGLCLLNGSSSNIENSSELSAEVRLEHILSCIDGVKKPQVMISYDSSDTVIGVVVVAGGVSHMETRLNVQSAVQTLLNVELSRIEIIDRG